ncbi:MAG TPA: SLC13 family permease [Gaiellaceae bacterium]|nr:SLC13 family permease [Gaiellaceae bacterium]
MLVHRILDAAGQTWPPFVLVGGLLLVGAVAAEDGLFEAVGGRLARLRASGAGLLVALLALDACVTAVLNLDTAVVFLTPVLVHAARARGLREAPFLYGSVLTANGASTLLPGSNLTNLLVLDGGAPGGGAFAARMLPAWLVSCAVTFLVLALGLPPGRGRRDAAEPPPLVLRAGAAATVAAAIAVVLLPQPALPVAAIGIGACVVRRLRPRLDLRVPALLFVVAVGLGVLARSWHGPAHLLAGSGRWTTAAVAAAGSVALNNLPAAVLFSAVTPPHPFALLLGLDLGPNLAVTGSLSAFLWLQAARGVAARPSIARYSLLGLVLVPLTLAASVAVTS